jgi:hypothetical protein
MQATAARPGAQSEESPHPTCACAIYLFLVQLTREVATHGADLSLSQTCAKKHAGTPACMQGVIRGRAKTKAKAACLFPLATCTCQPGCQPPRLRSTPRSPWHVIAQVFVPCRALTDGQYLVGEHRCRHRSPKRRGLCRDASYPRWSKSTGRDIASRLNN